MPKKKLQGVEAKPYTLVLDCGDKYEVQADSIAEGIAQFKPTSIKIRSVLTAYKDGKSSEMAFYPPRMKKLLVNKTFQIIIDKWMNAKLQ